jgi:hypothetical protein
MRRLVIILLLIVYPFQVALAMADKCCTLTPGGVSHHSASASAGGSGSGFSVEPVFVADDSPGLGDPHCAACSFGHTVGLPSHAADLPAVRHHAARAACPLPFATAAPCCRPERPKWSSAAE